MTKATKQQRITRHLEWISKLIDKDDEVIIFVKNHEVSIFKLKHISTRIIKEHIDLGEYK